MQSGKRFWLSKTFWVNVLALVVLIAQSHFGLVVSLEVQASILAAVNVALRLITKEQIAWR